MTHISSFAAVKHQMEKTIFVLPLWRREEREVSRGLHLEYQGLFRSPQQHLNTNLFEISPSAALMVI